MDDAEPPQKTYPLSPAKMSKIPSWITLGFVLGALSAWSLLREKPAPPALVLPKPPPPRVVQIVALAKIEAVFADWGAHATWADDLTEVALWSDETKSFNELYEVKREGVALRFRTVPKLTRRIIRHGRPLPDSPLQFTETEGQYREWLDHGRTEAPPVN